MDANKPVNSSLSANTVEFTPKFTLNSSAAPFTPSFTLNPSATPFIPRSTLSSQDPHHELTRSTSLSIASRITRPHVDKSDIPQLIKIAYTTLKNHQYEFSEDKFRSLLDNSLKDLTLAQYQNVVIGLSRSLNHQGHHKSVKACSLLEQLKHNNSCHKSGVSSIKNLDLTLSLAKQNMGKHKEAESLLLVLSEKCPDSSEVTLCKPCGDHKVDLALARLWQVMDENDWAEKLLLAMSHKQPGSNEATLCEPCGKLEIDLTLARQWQVLGKNDLAEKLLLAMSHKQPGSNEATLCKPCGKPEVDLALARHWQVMDKNDQAEKLLLAMSHKQPDSMCKPCGNPEIDLTLARLWQVMGKNDRAEKLLLAMSHKQPGSNEATLCKPSGKPEIDLTLARLWLIMDKNDWAETLLENGLKTNDHLAGYQLALSCLYVGTTRFNDKISSVPYSADKCLVLSCNSFFLFCQKIESKSSVIDYSELDKAKKFVDEGIKEFPPNAKLYTQKAHCLRMAGEPENEWRDWFTKANSLDPLRALKNKSDSCWRMLEYEALRILKLT